MPKEKKGTTSKPKSAKNDSYIICPVSEEKIWISNVTLADMKKAARTGECPHNNKKKVLVRIPSKAERLKRYEESARALEAKEEAALPTYGGRSWKVTVTIKDPKSGKGKTPLFRWFRGSLELACLPHMLEKIPDPPKQRGITMLEEEEEEVRATALSERVISVLSVAAWNDREHAVPTVTTKWMSPNHVLFYSRKAAWEHSEELVKQQIFLDKIIRGYGARGQELRPFKPTRAQALLAGRQRFLRDGLWVVGQEESWQEERSKQLEKNRTEQERKVDLIRKAGSAVQNLETAEQQISEVQGKIPTLSDGASIPNKQTGRRKLSAMKYFIKCNRELFRNRKVAEKKTPYGQELSSPCDVASTVTNLQTEIASGAPSCPRSNEEIAAVDESKVLKNDANNTPPCDPLSSRISSNVSTVAPVSNPSASPEPCTRVSKVVDVQYAPLLAQIATSEDREKNLERKNLSAIENPNMKSFQQHMPSRFPQSRWHMGGHQPVQNSMTGPHGPYVEHPPMSRPFAANPQFNSMPMPTPSGIIGIQIPQHHRAIDSGGMPSNGVQVGPFAVSHYGGPAVHPPYKPSIERDCGGAARTTAVRTHSTGKATTQKCKPPSEKVIPTAATSEECTNTVHKKRPTKESAVPKTTDSASEKPYPGSADKPKFKAVAKPTTKKVRQKTYTLSDADKDLKTVWRALSDEERNQWAEHARRYEEKRKAEEEIKIKEEGDNATKKDNSNSEVAAQVGEGEKFETNVKVSGQKRRDPSPTSVACNDLTLRIETKNCGAKFSSCLAPILESKTEEMNKEARESEVLELRPPRRITPSFHWRLKPEYIALCYDAVMDHYHKVMYTVKARGLYQELADGFDVFRERGRGRYDMELPVFDTPLFDFLTDPEKATWIPVVKKILGDDAILIHKGSFLSMPGAEMQVYHQDGPHLTTKYHRPCHAVNVFIPLVDLHSRNGPTEFCLGSHILGNEDFVREQLFTPEVPAGTPVIFDYRLGHRGMGNTSSSCRPIVYCTYAASSNGKEFRDSINFSRRRYQKLGDLLDLPLSREERAKKRQRS